MKDHMYIDIETFSEVDIKDAGTVKYCQSAEVMLIGMKLNGKYAYYDRYMHGEELQLPQWALDHIKAQGKLVAHNALFEYVALKPLIPNLAISQFVDTMALCGAAGLPLALGKSVDVLNLDVKKYAGGGRLITKFCIPRKPTKHNKATRVYAQDAPEDWIEFRDTYLRADVESMEMLHDTIPSISKREQEVWYETQVINLDGIPVDEDTVHLIQSKLQPMIDEESSAFIRLTSLFPTQRDKVLGWVRSQGVKILDLKAETVAKVLEDPSTPEVVVKALQHRANTTHMSFKKYDTMLKALCSDGTVKGTLMYYAAHTGRFGGRLLQPQNLTRGSIDGNEAVGRIHAGEFNVELVKSAVRPMIYSPKGLSIVDYTMVEAIGVQWLSGDTAALRKFTSGQDPYKLMACDIYELEYEEIDAKQRFVGKQAVLGLGFQMAYGRFIDMVENYGERITVAEAKKAVAVYRAKHPTLVQFWKDIEGAALMAMDNPGDLIILNPNLSFKYEGLWLEMILPSGRPIRYFKPNVEFTSYGRSISYMGVNDRNQYVRTQTYGGKLTENAVQGLCRDLVVHGISNVMRQGIRVITHVHDEIVAETSNVELVERLACNKPNWAEGFPLMAEGVFSNRYIKA